MRIGNGGRRAIALGGAVAAGVFGLGVALARESPSVRAERDRLDGTWVATSVRSEAGELTGADAARFGLEFRGDRVVARGLAGVPESAGTYQVNPDTRPGRLDLRLESGIALGIYGREGDDLVACFNPLDLPEHLGLPERGRAVRLEPDRARLLIRYHRRGR